MTSAVDRALQTFHDTGVVTLPGAPSSWSRVLRVLIMVLLGLVALLMLSAVVVPVVALLLGLVRVTAMTFVGAFGVLVLGGVLFALVMHMKRTRDRFIAAETSPVVFDRTGLTLRGVGPIPWADFGPAGQHLVQSEHDSGRVRRAVMLLTPSGLLNVNSRLAPASRPLLGGTSGPLWSHQRHRYISVPGIADMTEAEVIGLVNAVHPWVSVQPN